MMVLPVALFVLPWPEPSLWPIMVGVFISYLIQKLFTPYPTRVEITPLFTRESEEQPLFLQ